jgi:hypothetical protein
VLTMRISPSGELTINQMSTTMDIVLDSSDPMYVWKLQISDSTRCMQRKNWMFCLPCGDFYRQPRRSSSSGSSPNCTPLSTEVWHSG